MNILFVCTGNTCRSPMAQGIAQRYLKERGISGVQVSSAGTAACPGDPATDYAVTVMEEIGVDLSAHRSKSLSRCALAETDVFAVMTASHAAVLSEAGAQLSKIHLLSGGICDPYGGSLAVYRECREQLKEAVEGLLDELCAEQS